jgi:ACS family tartrate transporter-like MFS transporter
MILYMTYWFPQATRARFIALFLAAVPLSNVIGAPLSGWLLGVEGYFRGWQNMLLIEGFPSVLLGIAVLMLLPAGPQAAKWLTAEEKQIIAARLAADRATDTALGTVHGFWEMLKDKRVWILMIPDFGIVIGLYALGLWMPQMIKDIGYSSIETGWLVALAYFTAIVAMVLLGLSSDRRGERVGHVAFASLAGAAGLIGAALFSNPVLIIASFCLAASGIYGALAVFWTLPTALLRGTAAAAGLALINSFANLGGFFGPSITGWLKDLTGNYVLGLEVMAGMLGIAAIAVLLIGRAYFPRVQAAP